MLTRFKALILGLAACAGLAGVAAAQNADVSYNPVTGLRGLLGVPVALGTPPVMTGCTTSAYNTLSWTVNANPVIFIT